MLVGAGGGGGGGSDGSSSSSSSDSSSSDDDDEVDDYDYEEPEEEEDSHPGLSTDVRGYEHTYPTQVSGSAAPLELLTLGRTLAAVFNQLRLS